MSDRLETLGAATIPFGPGEHGIEVAQDFGEYPAEYAAIRKHVGVLHLPQRAILRLTGKDVKDFLHRLVTQDINTMAGGTTRRSFQLNEKGRILADLLVHHGDVSGGDTWLETDVFDIAGLRATLDKRLFSEDVLIEDWTGRYTCFAILGPASGALLAAVGDDPSHLNPGEHHVLTLDGGPCTVYRWDDCGVLAFRVFVPAARAAALHEALLAAAGYEAPPAPPDAEFAARRRASLRGRPIGWSAYNTARIEHRTPLFHIDFGYDSLPAETGLLDAAVSFTKGCYLGQEIVARMKSLGHPKRVTVGVDFESDALPVAGAQVVHPDDPQQVIGGLTSSTPSPLRGNQAVGLAVMKWGFHLSGTKIACFAEGKLVRGGITSLDAGIGR